MGHNSKTPTHRTRKREWKRLRIKQKEGQRKINKEADIKTGTWNIRWLKGKEEYLIEEMKKEETDNIQLTKIIRKGKVRNIKEYKLCTRNSKRLETIQMNG